MKFKGIIFDMDGTIVDSKLNFEAIRTEIGIPEGNAILEYLEDHDDETFINSAMNIVHRHEMEGAKVSTIIRDYSEFYEFLEKKSIPKGLLTRNSKPVTDITLEMHNLKFKNVLTRDCCLPKPHPEGLLLISKQWNIDPTELVYVGDYKFDLETAKAAGMKSALILNEYNSEFIPMADITFQNYKELYEFFQ